MQIITTKLLFAALLTFALIGIQGVEAKVAGNNLIKAGSSSVYYLASDGKRYVFPTENTFKSWFIDFKNIIVISDEEMSTYPLGGNVTYRPAYKMVKITTDPKVYMVDRGGILRWVTSESIAVSLYGPDWNKKIDDVPDAFFTNYKIGSAIENIDEIQLIEVFINTPSINKDKNIVIGDNPKMATTNFIGDIDTSAWKTINTANFSISLPLDWNHIKEQGIDSIVGKFVNENENIELTYDYGAYTGYFQGNEFQYNITYETIDGLPAQIVQPRLNSDDTFTTLRFENITNVSNEVDLTTNFSLGGKNLTIKQREIVLRIFRSVRFKVWDCHEVLVDYHCHTIDEDIHNH